MHPLAGSSPFRHMKHTFLAESLFHGWEPQLPKSRHTWDQKQTCLVMVAVISNYFSIHEQGKGNWSKHNVRFR